MKLREQQIIIYLISVLISIGNPPIENVLKSDVSFLDMSTYVFFVCVNFRRDDISQMTSQCELDMFYKLFLNNFINFLPEATLTFYL